MRRLFQIGSKHPDPVHATHEWADMAVGKISCPTCKTIYCSRFPEPYDVFLKDWNKLCITGGVCWTGAKIFHKNFIDHIFDHLSEFSIGKCYDSDGNIIENYVTCYAKKYIVERGDKESRYNICSECGSIANLAWWGKKFYILQSYLTESKVYQDAYGSLYIDEEIAPSIKFSFWPDADLCVREVLEKPLDGQHLPCDPPGLW